MKQEEVYELLDKEKLNPKYIDIDDVGFTRWIEFNTKYQKCWIQWWQNYSSLRIGDRYGNEIYFNNIAVSIHSPSNERNLEFFMEEIDEKFGTLFNTPCRTSLILKKLDWQKTK